MFIYMSLFLLLLIKLCLALEFSKTEGELCKEWEISRKNR